MQSKLTEDIQAFSKLCANRCEIKSVKEQIKNLVETVLNLKEMIDKMIQLRKECKILEITVLSTLAPWTN